MVKRRLVCGANTVQRHWSSYSCLAWPLLMIKAAYYKKYNEGTCNLYRMSRIYASLLFGLMICAAHVAGYSSNNYTLQFSSGGVSDYVNIWGMPSLTQFTVCLWMKSSSGNDGTSFSYAVNGQDNELLLFDYASFEMYIGGQFRKTRVSANDGYWHHICVTWTNRNGGWHIYKDGVLHHHSINFMRGYTIKSGGSLVLGQEQDRPGGSFDSNQRFLGLLTGVNVWNTVLSASVIRNLSRSCFDGLGSVYRWSDFRDAIKGNTGLVVPSNCSPRSTG
ncbi:neuronal pentraxin-2-like isoform X2 [Montipora foliosa]|uniref:neuronal pentraxin-2-like isoform X2 n=1 Tax=Montipora foliosa TaxID=591990 RepID=UPI0035F13E6A